MPDQAEPTTINTIPDLFDTVWSWRDVLGAEQAARHKKVRRQVFAKTTRSARANIDTLVQTPDTLRAIVKHYETGAGPLILCGGTGAGKTYTAAAVINERIREDTTDIILVTAERLLASLKPGGEGDIEALIDAELLVIDDLGADPPTEWATGRLLAIIDGRWQNGQETIITTNLTPGQLGEHVGTRTWSRLTDQCALILLPGIDRRHNPVNVDGIAELLQARVDLLAHTSEQVMYKAKIGPGQYEWRSHDQLAADMEAAIKQTGLPMPYSVDLTIEHIPAIRRIADEVAAAYKQSHALL